MKLERTTCTFSLRHYSTQLFYKLIQLPSLEGSFFILVVLKLSELTSSCFQPQLIHSKLIIPFLQVIAFKCDLDKNQTNMSQFHIFSANTSCSCMLEVKVQLSDCNRHLPTSLDRQLTCLVLSGKSRDGKCNTGTLNVQESTRPM